MGTAALEQSQNSALLDIPDCEFTPIGLNLPPNLTFDQWDRIGRQLQLADIAIQWWIGDWLVYGEHRWGDKYAQAIEVTGRREQTLKNYHFVASSIEKSRRRYELNYSIHAEVAPLEPEEQDRVLAKAAGDPHPTVKGVRRQVDKIRRDKMPKVEDDATLLSKEAREFLDDYMIGTAEWAEKIPSGIPLREREALEKMIFEHGAHASWLRGLTRGAEFKAITELFSFEEGVPSTERAEGNHIFKYLDKSGYYLGEDELLVALDSMVVKNMLMVLSADGSRKDGQRGSINDLYGLHPAYEQKMEADRLKQKDAA